MYVAIGGETYVTAELMYVAICFQDIQKSRCFRIENSGICFWNVQELLFPVVPDVLDIVVIFHGVDELLHHNSLVVVQGLVVLGNHFNLSGDEGVLAQVGDGRNPNFLRYFEDFGKTELSEQNKTILWTYSIIQGQHKA